MEEDALPRTVQGCNFIFLSRSRYFRKSQPNKTKKTAACSRAGCKPLFGFLLLFAVTLTRQYWRSDESLQRRSVGRLDSDRTTSTPTGRGDVPRWRGGRGGEGALGAGKFMISNQLLPPKLCPVWASLTWQRCSLFKSLEDWCK